MLIHEIWLLYSCYTNSWWLLYVYQPYWSCLYFYSINSQYFSYSKSHSHLCWSCVPLAPTSFLFMGIVCRIQRRERSLGPGVKLLPIWSGIASLSYLLYITSPNSVASTISPLHLFHLRLGHDERVDCICLCLMVILGVNPVKDESF